MRIRFFLPLAAALALSGCAASGGISALGQAIPGIAGQLDSTVNAVILQKETDLHNLRVGLEQIDATPGMVMQVTPPPVIGTVAPTPMPMPAPTPVIPAPISTPAPITVVPAPPVPFPTPVLVQP